VWRWFQRFYYSNYLFAHSYLRTYPFSTDCFYDTFLTPLLCRKELSEFHIKLIFQRYFFIFFQSSPPKDFVLLGREVEILGITVSEHSLRNFHVQNYPFFPCLNSTYKISFAYATEKKFLTQYSTYSLIVSRALNFSAHTFCHNCPTTFFLLFHVMKRSYFVDASSLHIKLT